MMSNDFKSGGMGASNVVSKVHSALDYRARLQSEPRYELSDIYPQTGQRDLILNETSEKYVEFELPPRCVNLSRSVLEFGVDVQLENKSSSTAKVSANHDAIQYLSDSVSCVQRIEVFSRTGVRLMDLQHQQLWSKISNSWFSPSKIYEKRTQTPVVTDIAGVLSPFDVAGANPWMSVKSDSKITTGSGHETGFDDLLENSILGNLYNSTIAPGASKQLYKKFYIDLLKFRESILSVDKSLYFGGQVLNIKITFSPFKQFLKFSKAATEVGTQPLISGANLGSKSVTWNEAANAVSDIELTANCGTTFIDSTTQAALTANDIKASVKIDELALRCAFETNPVIISQIKSKVMSGTGLKLFMPYVHTFKESRSNPQSGKCSVITRLNRGYGVRVQRIVTTVTPELTAGSTREHESIFGVSALYQKQLNDKLVSDKPIFKSYYTTLNNRRLQERDIVVLDSNKRVTADHWNSHKDLVQASICDEKLAILNKFAHVDCFDAYRADKEDFSNVVTGLPLSDDMQHTINADFNANAGVSQANVYTFCVVQRSLQLRPDSITLV